MIKQFVYIFNYKIIYQIIYVIFNILIIKHLSVEEYGNYSYLLALIIYFSALIQLGLPVYIQKNIAQKKILDKRIFHIAVGIFLILVLVNYLLQDTKIFIILSELIILSMVLISIVTSIQNGKGNYIFQYKIILLNSVWMLFIVVESLFFKVTILNIFVLWAINALFAILYIIYFLKNSNISYHKNNNFSIKGLVSNMSLLLTLFFVSVPYETFRMVDKVVIKERYRETLLGYYSFNLFAIMMVFSFSIRPLSSIILTKLSQSRYNFLRIKYTVFFILVNMIIFILFYIFYHYTAYFFLNIFGLEKYLLSIQYFDYIWFYMLIYSLSIPFIMIISIELNNRKRLIYMILSLILFIGLPLLSIYGLFSFEHFLILICISFLAHLILVIIITQKQFKNLNKILLRYIKIKGKK